MKNNFLKFRLGILLPFFFLFMFFSCKKDETVSSDTLKEQTWASEVYTNMKDIYLWNDALPASFDATKYPTATKALDYLAGLKISTETNEAIDHYSFLDKIGNLSSEISGGTASGDYGFMITAAYTSSTEVSFFVNYVYKNSPAGLAGVARSYQIISVNGSTAVHPEANANGSLVASSTGYTTVVNALFDSSTASFGFKKPDGTTFTVSLNTASYSINSVLCDTVYPNLVNSKKVGYLVFNEFLGSTSQTELTNSITKFQNSGVQSLIVDLRYNGGGSVETCEMFCNLIAPSAANGQIMYSYKMNAALTAYYASTDMVTKFAKTNSFKPTEIYFIVSGNTASAAELLINNLRPYYSGNLFLIGQTTYGKPCGFWATPIGYTDTQTTTKEGYDLYAVSFEMVNSLNQGGYYSGMTPGTTNYPGVLAYDSYNLSWGNQADLCIAQAINHISTGAFISSSKSKVKQLNVTPISSIDRQFKGMIDFRKHPVMH